MKPSTRNSGLNWAWLEAVFFTGLILSALVGSESAFGESGHDANFDTSYDASQLPAGLADGPGGGGGFGGAADGGFGGGGFGGGSGPATPQTYAPTTVPNGTTRNVPTLADNVPRGITGRTGSGPLTPRSNTSMEVMARGTNQNIDTWNKMLDALGKK